MDEFNNNPIQGNNDNNNNNPIQRSGESNQGQNQNFQSSPVNNNQNGNVTPKKKSKAPLIIGIVCAILILGCVVIGGVLAFFFGILPYLTNAKIEKTRNNILSNEFNAYKYNLNVDKNEMENAINSIKNTTNSMKNTTNEVKNVLNSINNTVANNTTGNNAVANNATTNNTTGNNTAANNTTENNESKNNTKLDVKTSTQGKPIKKGEWGAAGKYNVKTSDYSDAYVKVTNFIRGEEAAKLVKAYADKNTYRKYEEPKEGMEYVVVEYDVDFSNFEIPSYGMSLDLSPSAKGTKEGSSAITYKNVNYYTTASSINDDYTKTSTGKGRFAVQVPIGCTDYVVSFGAYGKTNTYVKGE